MALKKIQFQPGIHKEGTQFSAGASWYDADKVRFRKGRPEKIGGWATYPVATTFPVDESGGEVTNDYRGVARSLYDWGTADSTKYLGVGTNLKFYVEVGGLMSDITPIGQVTAAGDVTFSATTSSSTITVSDTSHGAAAGDYVKFTGATSLGGNITATVLNHEYEIDTIVDADSYTITARNPDQTIVTANASDTGSGGAATVGNYQINTGTNSYLASTGYSVGTYGSGPWGGSGSLSFAGQLRLWSQDAFADDLVICPRGGGIYYWDESVGVGTRAVALPDLAGASDAPIIALQVMVSPVDRHIIVFGCNDIGSSNGDPLLVRWADEESATMWTPKATNSAGGQVLSSGSEIIGAVKTRHEILIFTDTTMHSMRFTGSPFIFQFAAVAENVTILSPNAAISAGDAVFFMDLEGFYVYQGAVSRLDCSVLQYVFTNLDRDQAFKVYASHNPDDSEVTWHYPTSSGEVDSYVTYNYQEGHWTIGTFERGAWIQASTRDYPVASTNDLVNVKQNTLYSHEFGYDANGSDMGEYIESGDVELDDGDHLMYMWRFIPDFRVRGNSANADFDVTIKGRKYPHATANTLVTKNVLATTTVSNVRVRAREVILRIDGSGTGYGWTMGDFRFDMRPDGRK